MTESHTQDNTKSSNFKEFNFNEDQYYSLFDILNDRIEKRSITFKNSLKSTISISNSEEEKQYSIVKTPNKYCYFNNYLSIDEAITSYSSPIRYNQFSQQMQLINEIKTRGKFDALQLNLKFQAILVNSQLNIDQNIDISNFLSEFDKCFEMIEVLQYTSDTIKTLIRSIEQQSEEKDEEEFVQDFDQTLLYQIYFKQVFKNSRIAKSLCQIIGQLLNTTLFQNQSIQVIESLFSLSELVSKDNSIRKNINKTIVIAYKDLLIKINDIEDKNDRVPTDLSEQFQSIQKEVQTNQTNKKSKNDSQKQ